MIFPDGKLVIGPWNEGDPADGRSVRIFRAIEDQENDDWFDGEDILDVEQLPLPLNQPINLDIQIVQ